MTNPDTSDLGTNRTGFQDVADVINSINLEWGTYTPTVTLGTNAQGYAITEAYYYRIGDIVTVSGQITANPSSTGTSTIYYLSIPISSTFSNNYELNGTGVDDINQCYKFYADTSNNRCEIENYPSGSGGQVLNYIFTYRVI